jgi:hypothetical protein
VQADRGFEGLRQLSRSRAKVCIKGNKDSTIASYKPQMSTLAGLWRVFKATDERWRNAL